MSASRVRFLAATLGLLSLVAAAPARADIYTCVDAKGRRLTADRPILECIDREQKELSSSGTVVRRIGPSLTADERALEDEKARKTAEERARVMDERRKDRALLNRFPDRAAHDDERADALSTFDEVIATAKRRIGELAQQRRKLDADLEFYKGDADKAPARLKRQFEENDQQVAAQKRFIENQEAEKKRVNARFDEELARLKRLWAGAGVASRPASQSKQ